jgi:hypothetical protein
MDRRSFLRALLALSRAAGVVDPERLLWTPKPIITVPSMSVVESVVGTFETLDVTRVDIFDRYEFSWKLWGDFLLVGASSGLPHLKYLESHGQTKAV